MTKDKSNIFKLEKEEQEKYKNNEFDDCMPGAKEFAQNLKFHILTKETPYVLLLEDNFGMGKTHFITRFCLYLRNQKINSIYFSAWENDYLQKPFEAFSKEILLYFGYEKFKKDFIKVATSILKLAYDSAKSVKINFVDIGKLANAAENFINNLKKEKDAIQEFKKELKNFIKKLPNQRLVIIVDELDRCRPDYAMKTLEVIKHLFDIEGLFIIVPTNIISLNKAVKSLYGIDDKDNENIENYCNKFFTDKFNLFQPNYLKFAKDYINENSFKEILEDKKMCLEGKYNSLEILQNKLAYFAQGYKLSLREMGSVCRQAEFFCKNYKKKIYSEYLAYCLCKRIARQENNSYKLEDDSPFLKNQKMVMLSFAVPAKVYADHIRNNSIEFRREFPTFNNLSFSKYEEFYNFYDELPKNEGGKIDFEKLRNINGRVCMSYMYDFSVLETYIKNKKEEIDNYIATWNLKDDEDIIKKEYDDFAKCECSLFNCYDEELKEIVK